MFRTDLLYIIRTLNTVYTAISICHTDYVDCLLADCQLKQYDKYLHSDIATRLSTYLA